MTSIPIHPAPVALPPGYPRECEETVELRNGRHVFIRPVVPADAAALALALELADPETLYFRFFRSTIRVDAELLEYLTVLDYDRRFALAAFGDDGTGAGIARYEGAEGSTSAEVAVTVDPAWRRLGLGSLLLARLEGAARRRGIRRFEATFLAENQGAVALMKRAGFTGLTHDGGVGYLVHDIDPAAAESPF
jgi:GNAT superfamily N-acetyltransferase